MPLFSGLEIDRGFDLIASRCRFPHQVVVISDMKEIPKGFCQCGCGGMTSLAPRTIRSKGYIKGEPVRFCVGHQNKKDLPLNTCGSCLKSDVPMAKRAHGSPRCKECIKKVAMKYHRTDKGRANRNAGRKRRHLIKKAFVYSYLREHPCRDCGEADIITLDFHHTGDKRTNISVMINRSISLRKVKAEIAQCIVLCANCHRRHTAQEQNWDKLKARF